MADDEKVIIDQKMLIQQMVDRYGPDGKINIITVGKILLPERQEKSEFEFYDFLDRLPHPRLDNLVLLACRIAREHHGNYVQAGKFLGVERRAVSQRLHKVLALED